MEERERQTETELECVRKGAKVIFAEFLSKINDTIPYEISMRILCHQIPLSVSLLSVKSTIHKQQVKSGLFDTTTKSNVRLANFV